MDVKTLIFVLLVPACTGAVMINQGCSAFPREIQFLCYQIGKIWGQNQISNNVVENIPSAEGEDHVALAINGVGYEHNKLQGCQIADCETCSTSQTCERCQPGYYTQLDADTEKITCVKVCLPNYVPAIDSSGKSSCTERLLMKCYIRKCMTCLDSMTCARCTPGYYPQFHSDWEETICVKKCFRGYSLVAGSDGSKMCKQIRRPKGCQGFTCTSCKRGFYMLRNVTKKSPCSRRCPKGYLKDRIRRKCVRWPK